MIFSNYIFILSFLFILIVGIQYFRYKRIAKDQFRISGILLIKILIRSIILLLLIFAAKAFLKGPVNNGHLRQKALFILISNQPSSFILSEDDQINIMTRIPANKFNQFELCLYEPGKRQFFQYIPPTSEQTFLHLLKIKRPFQRILKQVVKMQGKSFHQIKRLEVYQFANNQWEISEMNQEDFNVFQFLNDENASVSPFLLHYLLILILCLLCLDLGITYRILKI